MVALRLALVRKICCGTLLALALSNPGAWAAPRVVHEAASDFNRRVYVVDRDELRSMRFGSPNAVDQSRIRRGHPEQLPMPYLRSAAVGLAVPETLGRLLVIGLGGGAFPSFVQARLPEVTVDAVEIDPVVTGIALEFFDLVESEKLRVHVMDAVDYVAQDQAPYDYLLLDAYDADDIPEALITRAFLADVHRLLAPGGVAVVNIATRSAVKSREITLKVTAHFDHCMKLRSRPSLNEVLLLADDPLPTQEDLRTWATRVDPEDTLGLLSPIASARACGHAEPSQAP